MWANIHSIWKNYFKIKTNVYNFYFSISLLMLTLFTFTEFLNFVESRMGTALSDPILDTFNPVNLTWLIFFLIYAALIIGIVSSLSEPEKLLLLVQSYILMILFRIFAMFVMPLNPPDNIIILNDPFVEYFGTGQMLTKDLFFSGHTATIFLFFLVSKNKFLKRLFLIFTISVGFALLVQHVHYSIDIFAAPFFSYGSFRIVNKLYSEFHSKSLQTRGSLNDLNVS